VEVGRSRFHEVAIRHSVSDGWVRTEVPIRVLESRVIRRIDELPARAASRLLSVGIPDATIFHSQGVFTRRVRSLLGEPALDSRLRILRSMRSRT